MNSSPPYPVIKEKLKSYMQFIKGSILIILTILTIHSVSAQFRFSAESGLVFSGYNDVRVPNGDEDPGTLFSLSEDFDQDVPAVFGRFEVRYLLNDKHSFELTAAPLTLSFSGFQGDSIYFDDQLFRGKEVEGRYEFNTYRASYRYRVLKRERLSIDAGLSILIRDARIALKDGNKEADDTDLGFVPLVSFELNYIATEKLNLMLKGDALIGAQGRAEDIFGGILYSLRDEKLQLKAGYRFIEGGADVDQVYNFALIHFADLGLVWKI